jgi:hypothetical protein
MVGFNSKPAVTLAAFGGWHNRRLYLGGLRSPALSTGSSSPVWAVLMYVVFHPC